MYTALITRHQGLLAAGLAVICYANVPLNGFSHDAKPIVLYNPRVNDAGQWSAIWTTDYWSHTAKDEYQHRDLLYRPITLLSYRLVHLFGSAAWPQHLVNVLLHAWISFLIVAFCRHIGQPPRSAMAAGFLFAVLPIHTEVVAGMVGRADLLAALGTLLALCGHRRSMMSANMAQKFAWRGLAASAVFVAMGAKESGASAVLLIALFDALWVGESGGGSRRQRWWPLQTVVRLSYLLVAAGAYFWLRYEALGGQVHQHPPPSKSINVLADAPKWQQALGVMQLWGMYWLKTIYPRILCIDYSINTTRLATSAADPHVLIGLVVASGLIVGSIIAWRKGVRAVAFLCTAIAVSYAPTANAFVLIQVFFAERIWYGPSVWAVMLAGAAIAGWMRSAASATAGNLRTRPMWLATGVVLMAVFTLRCWDRNAEWRNDGTLYAAAHRDHPNGVGVLQLLGQWKAEHGDFDGGVALLKRALEIDLGYTDAHRALGKAYLRRGDAAAAIAHLQVAQMQVPGDPQILEALALAQAAVGERWQAELERLKQAADENPSDVNAEVTLIRRLRETAGAASALARLRLREAEFDDDPSWQAEYAVTQVFLNRPAEAIERYRKCLGLRPQDAQVAVELAMLLLERRDKDDLAEAAQWAEHAAKVAPGHPPVLVCRAEVLAASGDLAGAAALYQQAITALPPDSPQRPVWQQRAKALGL